MAPNNKQTKNKQQNSDKTEDDRRGTLLWYILYIITVL
jgi:hypothetical protein